MFIPAGRSAVIASWIERGMIPFFFTHARSDAYAPEFAVRFLRRLQAETPKLDFSVATEVSALSCLRGSCPCWKNEVWTRSLLRPRPHECSQAVYGIHAAVFFAVDAFGSPYLSVDVR